MDFTLIAGRYETVHVLIAEDDRLTRQVALEMCHAYGCTAMAVADGYEAVKEYREHPADLVFLDIDMPVMNGCRTAAAIGDMESEMEIPESYKVAVTGDTHSPLYRNCAAAGVQECHEKPFTLTLVRECLDNCLKFHKGQGVTLVSQMKLRQKVI